MQTSQVKSMQRLFAGAYLLLIISTIALFKSSSILSLLCFAGRAGALVAILMLWLSNSTLRLKANRTALLFGVAFIPYLLTDARMAYLDVMILLVMASTMAHVPSSDAFLKRLAYLSLGVVVLIAALASLSLLPSNLFEWKDRLKNSMGFTNPNTFFYYILSSAFVFFVYRVRLGFFLCGALIVGLYNVVGSRTFLIAYLLLMLVWMRPSLLHRKLVISTMWLWFSLAVTLGLLIALFPAQTSIALTTFTGLDVNELTSSRFELISESISRSTLQLMLGGKANNADSLYVYFLNDFGLVSVPVFLYATVSSLARHVRQRNPSMLALACIYFTIGLIEVPFDGSALIALVFVFCVFFQHPRQGCGRHELRPDNLSKQASGCAS